MEVINHKGKHYLKTETGYREILASTDKSLGLPQIPQSFIEDFVKAFNNLIFGQYIQGTLIKVMVEYEPKRWINNPKLTKEQDEQDFDLVKSTEDYDKYLNYGLKINPDNTINIKSIEVDKYEDLFKAIDKIKEGHKGSAVNFIERFINTQDETLNREEVINKFQSMYNEVICNETLRHAFNKWIEENL